MLTIRGEAPGDEAAIHAVILEAFSDHGTRDGAPEARLVDAIRAAPGFDRALSLVAETSDGLIGHLLFSPCAIESGDGAVPALALAPLAVLPGYEALHAGTRLMREGLRRCTERGHGIVVVLGHATYYRRFGFRPANDFGIHPPWQVAPANFQVLALQPGTLDGVTGAVRYPAAFDAL
ncbi:MAG: N-acetyltransferase [Dehalococcoidia bacterium]|nr:N-acetyltransferase [Dehalococcoidia bacterium]